MTRRRRRTVAVPGLGELGYDVEQPCGLPFDRFRTKLRFDDGYEWIAWRKNEHGEDLPGRPSAKAIVRQLSRAKAWLYQEYLAACEPFRVAEASRPGCGPVCHPKRSQPCGKACIPLDARCKTPPDTACSFEEAYGAFAARQVEDDEDDGWTAEDFSDEPFTLFGLGQTCPPLRFEAQDRGDFVLVRARDQETNLIEATLRADRVGDDLQVKAVRVDDSLQWCGVGTRLYEEVAKVACAEGRTLRSDRRRSGYSEAFWRKQAVKKRAKCKPGSGINLSYKDRSTPKELRGKAAYWPCETWSLEDACREGGLRGARSKSSAKAKGSSCPHAKRFRELVNMSPAQIRAWAKDPRSKLASEASTRARLPKLAKLKAKPVAEWTEADCRFAARVVSFNARMDGMRREHGCTTKIDVALRNWGRRAPGCKLPKR